jgi:hypothetical protein
LKLEREVWKGERGVRKEVRKEVREGEFVEETLAGRNP